MIGTLSHVSNGQIPRIAYKYLAFSKEKDIHDVKYLINTHGQNSAEIIFQKLRNSIAKNPSSFSYTFQTVTKYLKHLPKKKPKLLLRYSKLFDLSKYK